LSVRCVHPLPGRATLYRILTRNNLMSPVRRKRRREDFIAWERPEPMQLWHLDIVDGDHLVHGLDTKVIIGVDDHPRLCVIGAVVPRAGTTCARSCGSFTHICGHRVRLADAGKR
jgi:hypothetical protein